MKKILIWMFAAILSCGMTTVFTSCNEDDVEEFIAKATLVGTWNVSATSSPTLPDGASLGLGETITFKSSGSFENNYGEEGDWSLNGWTLKMKNNVEDIILTFNIHEDYTPSRVVMDNDVVFEGMNNKYHITVVLTKENKK
ncbi:MAG: hypothetical protein IKX22_04665 [Prevotella sp.]|nr:hypothetical protein [Prevotella sp.]